MPPRILVIDDQEIWREQLRDALEAMGLAAETAESIEDAKALLKENRYFLILLDVGLDFDHGEDVLPLITQNFCNYLEKHYPDIPVLAITGRSLDASQGITLGRLGVVDCIFKSKLQIDDLERRIRDILPELPSISEDELVGKIIDQKYHIVEKLGIGGMARVYKAAHLEMSRFVAIKVMKSYNLVSLNRFVDEAMLVANLRHANIVQVHDFGRAVELADNMYYMVMELIEGPTFGAELRKRWTQHRFFTLAEIADIFRTLGGAIDYAHTKRVIHRDLKPANIMLTSDEELVLTDFGIARLLDAPFTGPSAIIGTPFYMSPEQASGKPVDERSDIYSLGVILYKMVTKRTPFVSRNKLEILHKHVNEPPPPPATINPNVPDAVEQVILKALEKDPDNRYQTAGDLAEALAAAI